MIIGSNTGVKNAFIPILKAVSVTFLGFSMIFYPQETFQAAFRGLDAWWSIVFPALLPFFVMSELLIGLGVVHFMGVLLEPVMRPLFNVPGSGAFVMAMGYTSGAPIGTMLSVELRKRNLCTRTEAQRLMSFTNNSSPLFLFGAVSVGMFHNPALGIVIALSHYTANLLIGFLLRFWGKKGDKTENQMGVQGNLIIKAFRALVEAQMADKRPLGTLLADAVKKSAQTLSMIGGFIIFFSVLIQIMDILGVLDIISCLLIIFLKPLGIDPQIALSIATGFFEITLGTKLASETSVQLPMQLIATSAILGWGGLSIHAQVASLIKETDLKMGTFIFARLLHSLFAPLITLILIGPVKPAMANTTPAKYPWVSEILGNWFLIISITILVFILACILVLLLAVITYIIKNLTIINLNGR